MKTLSNSATIINRDGYVTERGVTVIRHDETKDRVATIQIARTEHRVDDLVITDDRIVSKRAGWEVVL